MLDEGSDIATAGKAGVDVLDALSTQRALPLDRDAVEQGELPRRGALDPRPVVAVIDQGGEDAGPAVAGAARRNSSAAITRCRKKSALTAQKVSSSKSPWPALSEPTHSTG